MIDWPQDIDLSQDIDYFPKNNPKNKGKSFTVEIPQLSENEIEIEQFINKVKQLLKSPPKEKYIEKI